MRSTYSAVYGHAESERVRELGYNVVGVHNRQVNRGQVTLLMGWKRVHDS